MFDNRLFNVNGEDCPMLEATLKLAFSQEGKNTTAWGWRVTEEHGMTLCLYKTNDFTPFMSKSNAETVTSMIWDWLCEQDANDYTLEEWEDNCDHDGHNGKGWRVYTGTWGDVGNGFIAVKPIYLWYGK
jgi:hypothetical protein